MGEVGTVAQVIDGKAIVELHPSPGCTGCKAAHACFLGDDMVRRAIVNDPIGVRAGDRVEVALRPNALVKASFIAYIVPVIALFVGIVLGQQLGGALGWPLSADVVGIFFGLGFLVLALVCIRWLSPRLERSGDYTLTITRTVPRGEDDRHPAGTLAGKEGE